MPPTKQSIFIPWEAVLVFSFMFDEKQQHQSPQQTDKMEEHNRTTLSPFPKLIRNAVTSLPPPSITVGETEQMPTLQSLGPLNKILYP